MNSKEGLVTNYAVDKGFTTRGHRGHLRILFATLTPSTDGQHWFHGWVLVFQRYKSCISFIVDISLININNAILLWNEIGVNLFISTSGSRTKTPHVTLLTPQKE